MLVEHQLHLYLPLLCFPFALWFLGRKKKGTIVHLGSSEGNLRCQNFVPINKPWIMDALKPWDTVSVNVSNWFIQSAIYSDPLVCSVVPSPVNLYSLCKSHLLWSETKQLLKKSIYYYGSNEELVCLCNINLSCPISYFCPIKYY